jgi:hypothetical protein
MNVRSPSTFSTRTLIVIQDGTGDIDISSLFGSLYGKHCPLIKSDPSVNEKKTLFLTDKRAKAKYSRVRRHLQKSSALESW